VTPVKLFFDLVFVFVVTQVTHAVEALAMMAFFIMGLSVPHAFEPEGWAFPIAYLTVVAIHCVVYLTASAFAMARGDLSEEEWSLIEPHLPLGERGPIPDLRRQFNAMMWRFRTGSPRRDLPAEYGPCPPSTTGSGRGRGPASSSS
jgi:hypothetical protein